MGAQHGVPLCCKSVIVIFMGNNFLLCKRVGKGYDALESVSSVFTRATRSQKLYCAVPRAKNENFLTRHVTTNYQLPITNLPIILSAFVLCSRTVFRWLSNQFRAEFSVWWWSTFWYLADFPPSPAVSWRLRMVSADPDWSCPTPKHRQSGKCLSTSAKRN